MFCLELRIAILLSKNETNFFEFSMMLSRPLYRKVIGDSMVGCLLFKS